MSSSSLKKICENKKLACSREHESIYGGRGRQPGGLTVHQGGHRQYPKGFCAMCVCVCVGGGGGVISMQPCLVPLAVTEAWQSSVSEGNVPVWEALQSNASCTRTNTGDDYPFIAIDFGKNFTVGHIAVAPPLSAHGRPLTLKIRGRGGVWVIGWF